MAIGNSKKQVLLVDKEYDVTQASIPMTNIVDIELTTNGDDINVICASMGAKRNYMDEYHSTATFNIETLLTGTVEEFDNGGTIETYSNLDSLFLLCGMKRDVSVVGEVTYTPDSNSSSNLNIDFYKENVLRTLVGSKGSFTLSGTVGQPLAITFNMSAYANLVPDDNNAVVPTNEACKMENIAVINKVSGVTIGGSVINMSSFTLNENAEIQDTYAVGLGQFDMTDFDYNLEVIAYRTKNDDTHWVAYAAEDLKEIIISATAKNGKVITLTIPSAKMTNVVDGDDAGRQIVTRTYRCQNVLGDDNISIKIS